MPHGIESEDTVDRPALLPALNPDEWPTEVPVLIVGGGPVGLSSAILLAQRGIEVFLVERRTFEARFPRAHLLNVRTMEIFQEMGVADDIYTASPDGDAWRKVFWYTSIDGPTDLHGLEIGQVPAWGGGADAQRYAQASPQKFANLPQIRLDRLLWAHADAACPGRIRANAELVGVDHVSGGGVIATIYDRVSGESRKIRAQYLIAADGGRSSAELLGIRHEGRTAIQDNISLYVSADLSMWREPAALLCHFVQPWGGGRHVGTLQALGPDQYGRNSSEWLVAARRRPGETPTDDETVLLARARAMLGVPEDHPMTLHAVSHWQYQGVVADEFRIGSCFVAGDAAHRHPPTGGLGLNGGVQDAGNLAWKLAAVLQGTAPDGLLDSYARERRPVAAYNTAHSLENAGRHAPIGAALGLEADMSDDEGWEQIRVFVREGAAGESRRSAVAAAIADNALDYSQLNVEAGYSYLAGAFVPEDDNPTEVVSSPIEFVSTTRPGSHLPHVRLEKTEPGSTDTPVSTLDLVRTESFTLFTDPIGAPVWRTAVAAATSDSGMGIDVVVVEDDAWVPASQVGVGGAVLVRPDRKVAWRSTFTEDPTPELRDARRVVLDGGPIPDFDAAEHYLRRIQDAADMLAG